MFFRERQSKGFDDTAPWNDHHPRAWQINRYPNIKLDEDVYGRLTIVASHVSNGVHQFSSQAQIRSSLFQLHWSVEPGILDASGSE